MDNDKSFLTFFKKATEELVTAVFNLFIFLPYYFSFTRLLTTLFRPWKHLITVKSKPGFSFDEWIGRISFNLISSGVGFVVRLSIIFIYIIAQAVFVLSLPLLILVFALTLPFRYFLFLLQKPDVERKKILRDRFLKQRLLDRENQKNVEAWFEVYYKEYIKPPPWWDIHSLFAVPPIGRDWSAGYTPILDRYSQELTQAKTHFKTLVDREKEIHQIALILSKSEEANVVIVGDEGVGKHTVVEALAKRIFEGKINPMLAYKRILKIDIEKIISQSQDVSQKETLLKSLFEEAREASNIVIFIDNFDKYISGAGKERIDLTSAITDYARSARIQFLAITTPFAYQKYLVSNETINRLFTKVEVFEIGQREAMEILMKAAFEIEFRLKLFIPYETIKETVEKSNFYITAIPFPEKAVTLLDEACVYLAQLPNNKNNTRIVTPDIVDTVLSQKTHIPVQLNQSLKDKLLRLESLLGQKIIAQKNSIDKLSSAMRKSFTLASSRKKPLASFLFLGPTGVGKTETAKALSQVFFGSDDYLIRFDMSFYQTQNDIAALVGSMDSGNPGLLTAAVRQKPYGVLLLDELEKAHKDLLNIFLTVFDEGYFTDGAGKRVDCKNLIVIATSNAGADFIFSKMEKPEIFHLTDRDLINHLVEQKLFTPEFLNRFDGVILYQPLDQAAQFIIAKQMIGRVASEAHKAHKINLVVSDQFLTDLVAKNFDSKFGARNLARVIRDEIEDKIAQLILADKIKKGKTINF